MLLKWWDCRCICTLNVLFMSFRPSRALIDSNCALNWIIFALNPCFSLQAISGNSLAERAFANWLKAVIVALCVCVSVYVFFPLDCRCTLSMFHRSKRDAQGRFIANKTYRLRLFNCISIRWFCRCIEMSRWLHLFSMQATWTNHFRKLAGARATVRNLWYIDAFSNNYIDYFD